MASPKASAAGIRPGRGRKGAGTRRRSRRRRLQVRPGRTSARTSVRRERVQALEDRGSHPVGAFACIERAVGRRQQLLDLQNTAGVYRPIELLESTGQLMQKLDVRPGGHAVERRSAGKPGGREIARGSRHRSRQLRPMSSRCQLVRAPRSESRDQVPISIAPELAVGLPPQAGQLVLDERGLHSSDEHEDASEDQSRKGPDRAGEAQDERKDADQGDCKPRSERPGHAEPTGSRRRTETWNVHPFTVGPGA